jgi:hypothetical protein
MGDDRLPRFEIMLERGRQFHFWRVGGPMNRGCGFALAALGIVVFLVMIIGGAGFQWVNTN